VWRQDARRAVVTPTELIQPSWSDQYALVFEVIDTHAGRVMASMSLASTVFKWPPVPIAGTTLLADRVDDSNGNVNFRILEWVLVPDWRQQ
jgi:hypothetical protein